MNLTTSIITMLRDLLIINVVRRCENAIADLRLLLLWGAIIGSHRTAASLVLRPNCYTGKEGLAVLHCQQNLGTNRIEVMHIFVIIGF